MSAPGAMDAYEDSAWLSEAAARAVTAGRGIQVVDGAYVGVLPIRSRHWVAQLSAWLDTDAGQRARLRCEVSAQMVSWVAQDEADHADYDTGRELRTAHASVAQRLSARSDVRRVRPRGVSAAAVQRVRWFLALTGWQQTIHTGRYLTQAERVAALRRHGRRQTLGASVRALTTPTGQALVQARMAAASDGARRRYERLARALGRSVRLVRAEVPSHQPRSGAVKRSRKRSLGNQARDRARTTTSLKDKQRQPHPLAAHHLAAHLAHRVPRISGASTSVLVEVVAPLAVCGWTAHDVLTVIDHYDRDNDLPPVSVNSQRNPLGLLIHRIRRACVPGPRPTATARPAAALAHQTPDCPAPEDRTSLDAQPAATSLTYTQVRRTLSSGNGKPLHSRSLTQLNLDRASRRTPPSTGLEASGSRG